MAVTGIPRFAGKLGIVITVRDAAAAFYHRAFGAQEITANEHNRRWREIAGPAGPGRAPRLELP